MSSPRAAWMLVAILEMATTMMKTKRGKPDEQEENLQRRGVCDLWPPGERFQRH